MCERLATPIAHVWVEIEGHVLELTFPEVPQLGTEAVYPRVEFSLDEIKSKIFDKGIAQSIASESYSSSVS